MRLLLGEHGAEIAIGPGVFSRGTEGNGPSFIDIHGGDEVDLVRMSEVSSSMAVGNRPSPDNGDPQALPLSQPGPPTQRQRFLDDTR